MNWWHRFRNLDRVEALEQALREQVGECQSLAELLRQAESSLELVQSRRVGAEALAVERQTEIDRQREEINFLRTEVERVLSERLKSLDILNQKLMEPRTEAPPPDMAQFRQQQQILQGAQAIRRIHDFDRAIDGALLSKLHPKFEKPKGVPMDETVPTAEMP